MQHSDIPGGPFVERFEKAVMQYLILDRARQGEVTREGLRQIFRGNLQMSREHLDSCVDLLVRDGHLRSVGADRFTATDDGREDVEKLQPMVLELPNAIHRDVARTRPPRSGGMPGA